MSRAVPPLLQLAEGGRVRPRKAPVFHPREIEMHLSAADLLRKLGDPAWRWSHFPAGERRDVRTGAKLKRMGMKPGWPDFILVSPRGLFHGLELKRHGEELTDEQERFQLWAIGNGILYAVVRSIDEAITVLIAWGAIRGVGRDAGCQDLGDAERARHLSRRKAIYEELHPETAHGAVGNGRSQSRQNGDSTRFTKEAAKITGKSEAPLSIDEVRE